MDFKSNIQSYVQAILDSAKKRNTEQGVLICVKTIESLITAFTKREILASLYKFNRAFIGIEAHGFLTQDEYTIITKLREIETQFKNQE